jgi:hypothetical protein
VDGPRPVQAAGAAHQTLPDDDELLAQIEALS